MISNSVIHIKTNIDCKTTLKMKIYKKKRKKKYNRKCYFINLPSFENIFGT